jgi:hypothetical protein
LPNDQLGDAARRRLLRGAGDEASATYFRKIVHAPRRTYHHEQRRSLSTHFLDVVGFDVFDAILVRVPRLAFQGGRLGEFTIPAPLGLSHLYARCSSIRFSRAGYGSTLAKCI